MGNIFDIQSFSIHDGPGTRTTVFFQGCPLRCKWCHNPESQPVKGAVMFHKSRCIGCGECAAVCPHSTNGVSARFTQDCTLCGKCALACYAEAIKLSSYDVSPEVLVNRLLTEKDIFDRSGGGVTFSGGEPLTQSKFLLETLKRLKANGVNTVIETSLFANGDEVSGIFDYIDLCYVDIKCITGELHNKLTGVKNDLILENIRRLDKAGKAIVFRTPIVPSMNTSQQELTKIADFICSLVYRHDYEILAYHGMCKPKYESMNRVFECVGIAEPTLGEMTEIADYFLSRGINTIIRM